MLRGFDWRTAIPILAFLGLVGSTFYVWQFPQAKAWSVLGNASVTAGAAAFAGAFLGLLFGIPLGNTASKANTGRYRGNTNLEQISDWLTKLLVGAGLVQLGRTPTAFSRLANALSSGLGGVSSSAAFGLALVVFYAGCGFFYLYLWSRLSLPKQLDAAESFGDAVEKITEAKPVDPPQVPTTPAPQTGGDAVQETPARTEAATAAQEILSPPDRVAGVVAPSVGPTVESLNVVGRQIRTEIRRLLAATGHAEAVGYPTDQIISALEGVANLPAGTLDRVRRFFEAQDQIRISGGNVDPAALQSAITLGSGIVANLKAAPIQHHIVYQTEIPIFADPACEQKVPDATGVILRSIGPGDIVQLQIVPMTRTDLRVGTEVSWEWNSNRTFGQNWYKDEDSEIKVAWTTSAEFSGRDLAVFD